MKYFYVNVEDRINGDCVCVGAMLVYSEALQLVKILEQFNATDILIYAKEMEM